MTYQRNQYCLIEELFFGSKQEAIEVFDKVVLAVFNTAISSLGKSQ